MNLQEEGVQKNRYWQSKYHKISWQWFSHPHLKLGTLAKKSTFVCVQEGGGVVVRVFGGGRY